MVKSDESNVEIQDNGSRLKFLGRSVFKMQCTRPLTKASPHFKVQVIEFDTDECKMSDLQIGLTKKIGDWQYEGDWFHNEVWYECYNGGIRSYDGCEIADKLRPGDIIKWSFMSKRNSLGNHSVRLSINNKFLSQPIKLRDDSEWFPYIHSKSSNAVLDVNKEVPELPISHSTHLGNNKFYCQIGMEEN